MEDVDDQWGSGAKGGVENAEEVLVISAGSESSIPLSLYLNHSIKKHEDRTYLQSA